MEGGKQQKKSVYIACQAVISAVKCYSSIRGPQEGVCFAAVLQRPEKTSLIQGHVSKELEEVRDEM